MVNDSLSTKSMVTIKNINLEITGKPYANLFD